jgi:hypothetical protein
MIGLILVAAVVGAAPADPIGPAKQGLVQCYAPDPAKKTCRSIGAYAVQPDGTIQNAATTLISKSPAIVMRTKAPVQIKAGAICGTIQRADLDSASFTYEGADLQGEDLAKLKAAIGSAMTPLIGHEVCTTFAADGEMLAGQVSLDGARKPDMDQKVVWVSPSEYSVAP